jgi:hypothetical protein
MLKMLKLQNPDKEYPSNIGLKWFEDEETILLQELNKNIDIETIAQNHNRTIGGINTRRKEIAYKMYLKNISMEEIMEKTKLDEGCITQTIDKRKKYNSKNMTETKNPISLESEITEMKNDIKELKNTIKELVEMMKAVYDFEDI